MGRFECRPAHDRPASKRHFPGRPQRTVAGLHQIRRPDVSERPAPSRRWVETGRPSRLYRPVGRGLAGPDGRSHAFPKGGGRAHPAVDAECRQKGGQGPQIARPGRGNRPRRQAADPARRGPSGRQHGQEPHRFAHQRPGIRGVRPGKLRRGPGGPDRPERLAHGPVARQPARWRGTAARIGRVDRDR